MRITVDTNILVRAATQDDPAQTKAAQHLLTEADHVAVPLVALCEFVWVMRRVYKRPNDRIALTIRQMILAANIMTDRRAVEAGLALLDAGGDFADGVIAFEGTILGGDVFASFDKGAVARLKRRGIEARLVA